MEISDIPTKEDDQFEFKSSSTHLPELKKKLDRAISGFANSGGGVFVAGLDASGNADGGFSPKIGRQDISDWVDQIVQRIEPKPVVRLQSIDAVAGRGNVESGNSVIVVHVPASANAPHMAGDGKYYVRSGAHTLPARHFIVEAIRSHRHRAYPVLRHRSELVPFSSGNGQCSIELIAVNDSPALDVTISADQDIGSHMSDWPIKTELIDKQHSFTVGFLFSLPSIRVTIKVDYCDVLGNKFEHTIELDTDKVSNQFKPFREDYLRRIANAVEDLSRASR